MAKRKKRVTVRKRKPTVRGRARSSSRTVRGKAAKRTTIKLRPKKGMAKAQRHTAKRKNARPIKPSVIPVAQTTIIDIAEERVQLSPNLRKRTYAKRTRAGRRQRKVKARHAVGGLTACPLDPVSLGRVFRSDKCWR